MERLALQEDWESEAEDLRTHLLGIAVDRASGVPTEGADSDGNGLFKMTTLGLTDEAMERLDSIDAMWSQTAMTDDSDWAAIKGRGFWHLMKLAGLYALSREGKSAVVELMDVLRAAHLIEVTIGDLVQMQQDVGSSRFERTVMEAMKMLDEQASGEIHTKHIARRMRLTARDLLDISSTLKVRGMIEVDGDTWSKP